MGASFARAVTPSGLELSRNRRDSRTRSRVPPYVCRCGTSLSGRGGSMSKLDERVFWLVFLTLLLKLLTLYL